MKEFPITLLPKDLNGVIIGSVGKKKKAELIKKATEMKLTIINKYNFPAKENKK